MARGQCAIFWSTSGSIWRSTRSGLIRQGSMCLGHIRLDDDTFAIDDDGSVDGAIDRQTEIGIRLFIPPFGITEGAGKHAAYGSLHGLAKDLLIFQAGQKNIEIEVLQQILQRRGGFEEGGEGREGVRT